MAPIDGVNRKFALRCLHGAPAWIGCMEILRHSRAVALNAKIALVNKMLREGAPWQLLLTHREGDIGAVIEAAEARRAEIYGALPAEASP